MISYAIPVCNEIDEIKQLLSNIFHHITENDEVVVLFDEQHGTQEVKEYLSTIDHPQFRLECIDNFDNDFSKLKNKFLTICRNKWIIQIDADEIPSDGFWEYIYVILEQDVDMILISRYNIVDGITDNHIKMWGWNKSIREGHHLINYPDYQYRIFKNNGRIHWVNKVHEVIKGYNTYAVLPENMFLWHIKDINRQEKQNRLYSMY